MLVVNKFKDRNPIVNLQAETMQKIVNDNHVFELTVFDDSEILDEEAVLGLHAMLPGEYIADVLVLWIDVIDDSVCIVLGWGSEDDDLVLLAHILEKFHEIWPQLDRDLENWKLFSWTYLVFTKLIFQNKNFFRIFIFFTTMDQCFVEVQ